jgi:hypothetical protein
MRMNRNAIIVPILLSTHYTSPVFDGQDKYNMNTGFLVGMKLMYILSKEFLTPHRIILRKMAGCQKTPPAFQSN